MSSPAKTAPRNKAVKARRNLIRAADRAAKAVQTSRTPADPKEKEQIITKLGDFRKEFSGRTPKEPAGPSYFAQEFDADHLSAAAGIPCSTLEQCASTVGAFVSGNALALPKRFGVAGESLVMEVLCDQTVPCSSLTAGSVVYVVVPLQYANRGGIVYARDPASTVPVVLGYLTPANDVESFSSMHSVLGAHLEVSCPTVLGGTTAQVANISAEVGHFIVNPVSLIGGKTAAGAIGRHVSKGILGSNSCSVAALTYGCNEASVLKRSAYDKQTSTAVKTITSNFNNPAAYPRPQTCIEFVAGTNSVGGYVNQGWTNDYSVSLSVPAASSQVMWNLASNGDYLKHVLYGDFDLEFQCFTRPSAAIAFGFYFRIGLTVLYADGTTLGQNDYISASTSRGTTISWFSTRGDSPFASKRGVPIVNATLTFENSTAVAVDLGSNAMQVRMTMHDISPDTTYLATVLTGVSPVANVYAKLRVATEVFPDITTVTGSVVNATNDLPANPHMMQQFLSIAEAGGIVPNARTLVAIAEKPMRSTNFGASAMSFIRKIARNPLTRRVANYALDTVLGPPIKQYSTATTFGHCCFCNGPLEERPCLLDEDFVPESPPRAEATFFGEGRQNAARKTGFQFPIVTKLQQGDDEVSFQAEINDVAIGDGKQPVEWSNYTYVGGDFSGRSCELAFLLAKLYELGIPIQRGLYTGAIEDFAIDVAHRTALIDILPVDDFEQKSAAAKRCGKRLRGFFPHGVVDDRETFERPPVNYFGNFVQVQTLSTAEVESNDGRTAPAFQLRLTW